MKTIKSRPTLSLSILSLCLVFLGINGFIGGYAMLTDPEPMGMALSVLDRTPFQNWTVPAFFLIVLWGCGSLVILASLWLRPHLSILDKLSNVTHEHWSWLCAVLLGVALMVWLTVQVFTLPEVAPIQLILFVLALGLILLPLLPQMRQYYEVGES